MQVQTLVSVWSPLRTQLERTWRTKTAIGPSHRSGTSTGQGIQKMGPRKHRIGMQHIQINKTLQYQTLAHLRHITLRAMPRSLQKILGRGHSHASESLASLAWRNISGIADCARWRSAVVFVAFRCLFPLHIVTTASHSSECAQICGKSLGLAMVVSSRSRSFRSSSQNHAFVIARRSRPIRDTAPCDKDSHLVCCTYESLLS